MDKQVLRNIERLKEDMFLAERKVADFISSNPYEVVELNVSDLADKSGASDATVIRLCKRLGYKGFYQMKLARSQLQQSTRKRAKALSYCQPIKGGGVKVLLRYFLTRK